MLAQTASNMANWPAVVPERKFFFWGEKRSRLNRRAPLSAPASEASIGKLCPHTSSAPPLVSDIAPKPVVYMWSS